MSANNQYKITVDGVNPDTLDSHIIVNADIFYQFVPTPVRDPHWKCYLFGSTDFIYIPEKGRVPNWFVRKMMHICLGCRWENLND